MRAVVWDSDMTDQSDWIQSTVIARAKALGLTGRDIGGQLAPRIRRVAGEIYMASRKKSVVGTLVHWTDEDGKVAVGKIDQAEVKYNANLGMDLTHVRVVWSDGNEPTQHTLESLRLDARVKIQP